MGGASKISFVWAWWIRQTLIGKFSAILIVAGLVSVPLIYVAMNALLAPTFATIEEKSVVDQTRRARNSLDLFEQTLSENALDYAVWDDAFNYIAEGDKAFEIETLQPNAYQNMGVDVQAYVRNDGLVRWSNAVDRQSGTVLSDETAFFGKYVNSGSFFDKAVSQEAFADLVLTERGLFRIQSQRVVRSDESGPSPGFLAMGVLMNAQRLSEALQVSVKLDLQPTAAEKRLLLASEDHTRILTHDNHLKVEIGLVDAGGRLVAIIEYDVPRNASIVGRKAIWLATAGTIVMLLGLVFLLGVSIRRIAVLRLRRLEGQVVRMRKGDFRISEDLVDGEDEISALARQFVDFDKELDEANAQLGRTAYVQGKADSAAGMLHNVRNALAPLRVLQERWLAEENQQFRLNMERAVREIDAPDCPENRRQALESFLLSAAREIANGGDARRATMAEAKSTIDQIAAILGSFDFDTSGAKASHTFDPLAVIRQEARILEDDQFRRISVSLPDTIAHVRGNRVQLGQVIGNLLVNAAEAIVAARPEDPAIVVTAREVGEHLEIRITDNGDGIETEKIAHIFERGYSTRKHKAGGLGMHWSAIAIRSMGGSLSVESEGSGKGTTVVIALPSGLPQISLAA